MTTEDKNAFLFLSLCKSFKIKPPVREHRFLDNRKFRFDFAWIEERIAVEIEGGIWINGGHNRGRGYSKDMEKYNLAVLNGWRVLRFAPSDIKKENTYDLINKLLEK
jgi:very-short-patch-repair endonuclease